MDQDQTKQQNSDPEFKERRCGEDRRKGSDRRKSIRYESCRRKNHGRRKEDKDPWKEALNFD